MASIAVERPSGLQSVCERLVRAEVSDRAERDRQRRLIATLFVAPFFACLTSVLALAGAAPPLTLIGIACAVLGWFWLAALTVVQSGRRDAVELLVAGPAVAALAMLLSVSGGLMSPLALLFAAVPVEAWIVARNKRAARIGGVLAVAGVASLALNEFLGVPAVGSPVLAHWLAPLAYAASLWIRWPIHPAEKPIGGETAVLDHFLGDVRVRLDRGGEVVDVSGEARSMLQLAPDLLFGTGLFERVHIADRVAYLCALADVRAGASMRAIETRLRLPAERGGSVARFKSFRLRLLADPAMPGAIVMLIGDMSEIQALREAIEEARAEAAGTDVAKSRFLAAVSHELRTPLNAIIGFSDVLRHGTFGPMGDPRQSEYVELIHQSGEHLLAVVNAILDVSKIEAGAYPIEPEPFQFRDAVDMCHAMMSGQAQAKSVKLVNEVGLDTGIVRADRRAVQQMLINLVCNAVKFTPAGGEVRIGAGRVGSRLTFWVADTGIGIAAADMERIGKPFVQVQNDYTRQFEGTGLGLSLVKGLVQLHDGEMAVESEPGQGTTVSISLPIAGPSGRAAAIDLGAQTTQRAGEGRHGALRKTA